MSNKVPPPLSTLRGHNVGVTALTHCLTLGRSILVSGDEEGSLFIWDLNIYRRIVSYVNLAKSRVQSLKAIKIEVNHEDHDVIFVQSRDNGILLLDLSVSIDAESNSGPVILVTYDSFESLFSRGDAVTAKDGKAILAYPSCLENQLITIRVIGSDAQTLISGTAARGTDFKSCPVFDICIKEVNQPDYLLFAAFEDGCLYVFSFGLNSTKTVPHLNCTGLKIELIRKFDFKISDFISAFDLNLINGDSIFTVIGSPLNHLTFLSTSLNQDSDLQESIDVPLKRQGVSAISIRQDNKLVAVACWDSTVKLYSAKTHKLLANLRHHLKQVQDIIFFKQSDSPRDSQDETKDTKYLMCCASMEGTISISDIY